MKFLSKLVQLRSGSYSTACAALIRHVPVKYGQREASEYGKIINEQNEQEKNYHSQGPVDQLFIFVPTVSRYAIFFILMMLLDKWVI